MKSMVFFLVFWFLTLKNAACTAKEYGSFHFMRRGTTCCSHIYISFAESRTRCIRVLVMATIQRWAYNVTHVRNIGINTPEKKQICEKWNATICRNVGYEHLMYQDSEHVCQFKRMVMNTFSVRES